MKIISRKDAKELGLTRYYTGRYCKYGHIAPRLVSNYGCVKCDSKRNRTRTEHRKKYEKQYYKDNRIKKQQQAKEYYIKNKEKIKQYYNQWRKANPEKCVLLSSEYLKRKTLSIPLWYEADKIKQLYLKRDELSELWGIQLHVDHIIPLCGKNVCGLHCWDNLQLLEASINLRKYNKTT